MLYMNDEGKLVIDDRDLPESAWAEWERERAERMAENQRRYERMREQVEAIERDRAIAAEVAERDATIEHVELAEEAALAELAAFGCIEFEPQFNWSRKSTPEERGWSRAVLDIIAEYGAAETESVFELF